MRALLSLLLALASIALAPGAGAQVEARAAAADWIRNEILDRFGSSAPVGSDLRVDLPGLPPESASGLVSLDFDPRTGRFVAVLADASGRQVPGTFAGTAVFEVLVPVLVRRVAVGEIVQPSDVDGLPVPANRVSSDTVVSRDDLVGKQVRRAVPVGRPVSAASVGEPVVVRRNAQITLVYEQGAVRLTASGRALQDGGVGDRIKVMNVNSNRTVEARVERTGFAVVGNGGGTR
jgi:flagella basal body P-ring formation protein FlgA